ncbi:TPA: Ref family recombination enhancement nuclease [Klebsiella aerogenes]
MSKKSNYRPVAARRHLARVQALGCIVCRNEGYGETPAIIHHIRTGQGTGQRADDFHTIPLRPPHHQFYGVGVSYHDCPKTWGSKYGTESELLAQVRREPGEEKK